MRIGIVGSDDYPQYTPFSQLLLNLKAQDSQLVIVVTDGDGFAADVQRAAAHLRIPVFTHYTDRGQYGKGATFKRNYHLAHDVDVLHAYWHMKSFGCGHIIGQAKAAGKEVHIHRHNQPDEIFHGKTVFKEKFLEPKPEAAKPKGRKVGTDEFGDDVYQ